MPKKASSRVKNDKSSKLLQAEGLILDLGNRQVTGSNGVWKLTPKECCLLEVFMRHPGQVLTRKVLMKEVWETDYLGDTRTLEVHVCWLRKKIGDDSGRPRLLRTVRRVGYRFGAS